MIVDIQETYEQVLASHWQKLHQIKELVDTDTGSALRAMSISDRRKELVVILNKKLVLEQLFDGLIQPEWYIDWYNKLKKYEDPFYRH